MRKLIGAVTAGVLMAGSLPSATATADTVDGRTLDLPGQAAPAVGVQPQVPATTLLQPGSAGPAPTSLPVPRTVRVATYNICNTTCGRGRFSWSKRRVALIRSIRVAHPDVLAVQEANTQRWGGRRHIDDVRRRLSQIGYRIASTQYSCTRRCTRGAHIFFRPDQVHVASLPGSVPAAGMRGMSTIAGTRFGRLQDRAVSWAFLTPNGGRRTTLYVSVHLPTEKNARSEHLRRAVARGLRPWAESLIRRSGLPKAEIVIAGDFNSFSRRQPNGAQRVLSQAGLIDGFQAPVKVNGNFGTVNYTPDTMRYGGFPPRPHRYDRISPARIDYVFATVQPLRHEVVLRRTRSGAFDDSYRASDHNMVLVDLPLG